MGATTFSPVTELIARAAVARAVAEAFLDPPCAAVPDSVVALPAAWALIAPADPPVRTSDLSLGELSPTTARIAPLCDWLSLSPAERAPALVAAMGLVVSRDCPPFEIEYCSSRDEAHRSQLLADVAGFYAAFGVAPTATGGTRRVDHFAHQAAFVALLHGKLAVAQEQAPENPVHAQVCRAALHAFLKDHLAWWGPAFCRRLQTRGEGLLLDRLPAPARAALEAITGTAKFCRAWLAAERLAAAVPATREIIQPCPSEVPDDQCGLDESTCADCSSMGRPPERPPG